ncbi:ABC transporter permease [Amycolatopsis sp. GM8]|uniref:ABC transporter permease n=1 Tax=Amycolatopsis sp. GM8 TaxID=2896530 RepID=UPI001F1AF2E3|nr:ABC transporter permease [Amycolatopsis sp. GM8]
MLGYIFAGIALGSIYAIAASGIVITYISSGVLNFAFGSMAYFLARLFYFLNTESGWSTVPAVIVTVLGAAPALGAALYLALFRHLRLASPLIRIVSTIGVSVALPQVALLLFGNETINSAPGLSPQPVPGYHILGATASLDQIIAFGCVVLVVVASTIVLRLTDVGLRVRAMVDTEALTSLSGINPAVISIGVWMVTTALAGLAGILAAPSNGLTPEGMTALMAAAFAAVVAARLRNLPAAVGIAMGMGILTDFIQQYLPPNSSLTGAILVSIPILVMGAFLVVYIGFSGQTNEAASTGGALDRAIRPLGSDESSTASADKTVVNSRSSGWSPSMLGPVVVIALIALMPLLLQAYWLTLLTSGLAIALVFLSYTMVIGEGGMIWLCQAAFAGIGAVTTAQLATNAELNPIVAAFAGALIATPIGLIIGLLTIRLGNLFVALVTLTFGLLADSLIFTRDQFFQQGIGVPAYRPDFLTGDLPFSYFVLAIFVVLALIVVNVRRSTTGLALAAVRYSEPGARTLGLSVLGPKLLISGVSTFIAALGGGFLALAAEVAVPTAYSTFTGIVWMAVLVTIGVRSIAAAILAGIAYTLLPGVFHTYLPLSLGTVPTLLFGLGAILLAVHPEGAVARNGRRLQGLFGKIGNRRTPAADPATTPTELPEASTTR